MAEKKIVLADQPTWSNIKEVADFHARNKRLGEGGLSRPFLTFPVKVRNDTEADRPAGACLEIGDPILDDDKLANDYLWFEGAAPTGGPKFGILKKALPDGETGDLITLGPCIALVDVSDASHGFARPAAGSYKLESADAGPVKILYAPDTGDDQLCAVVVGFEGGSGTQIIRFRLTDEIFCELCQARATVLSRPPGVARVQDEDDYGEVMVYDLGMNWLNEPYDDLEGRVGYAALLEWETEECAIDPNLPIKWEIMSLGPVEDGCDE